MALGYSSVATGNRRTVISIHASQLDSLREQLRSLRSSGDVEVYERVDLRAWTAARIGGLADLVIRCKRVSAVEQVVDLLASHGVPWLVLGAGSRLVAPDKGLRAPLVSFGGPLLELEVESDGVVAGAGANLSQLGRSAARAGLGGLDPLLHTHGSVGGAVVAAARTCRGEALDLLDWAEVVWPGRDARRLAADELCDQVQRSAEGRREVVTRVRLTLKPESGSASLLARSRLDASRLRDGTTFLEPVFEDPVEVPAQQLLERAQVKGRSVGGARVADGSANRITTSRRASAAHVAELCVVMRRLVKETFDVELALSLDFVDEAGRSFTP